MWFRIYLYGLLQALLLDQFLWFIYLLHIGYNPFQIGVGYSSFQLSRLVLDIPSSWFGDRFGKKSVFLLASVAKSVSSVCFLLANHGFMVVILGFVTAGFSTALPSGVDFTYLQSVVEDTAVSKVDSHFLQKKLSTFMTMQLSASLVAGVLGGGLAKLSFQWLYIMDFAVGVLTFVAVLYLPKSYSPAFVNKRLGWHWNRILQPYTDTLEKLKSSTNRFRTIGVLAVIVWSLSAIQSEYTQGLLLKEGMGAEVISLVFAAGTILSITGSFIAGYIRRAKEQQLGIVMVVWIYCVSALLRTVSLSSIWTARTLSVLGIGFQRTSSGFSGVLINNELLTSTRPDLKSAVLSSVNTVQVSLMMLLGPLFGLMASVFNFHVVFFICSFLLGLTGLAYTWIVVTDKQMDD